MALLFCSESPDPLDTGKGRRKSWHRGPAIPHQNLQTTFLQQTIPYNSSDKAKCDWSIRDGGRALLPALRLCGSAAQMSAGPSTEQTLSGGAIRTQSSAVKLMGPSCIQVLLRSKLCDKRRKTKPVFQTQPGKAPPKITFPDVIKHFVILKVKGKAEQQKSNQPEAGVSQWPRTVVKNVG